MKVTSLCLTLLFSVAAAALAGKHAEDVPQDATLVERSLHEAQETKSDHVQHLEQDLLADVPEDVDSEGNSPRRDLANYYGGGGYSGGGYGYSSGGSYGYGRGTGNVYGGGGGYTHRYSGGGHGYSGGYNGGYNYGTRYVNTYPSYSGSYYRGGGGYNYGYRGGYYRGKSKGKGMGYYYRK